MSDHCEQRILAAGSIRPCGQIVGLSRWWDTAGRVHVACHAHRDGMRSRWTPADPPEPDWRLEEITPRAIDRAEFGLPTTPPDDAHGIGCPARHGDGDCDEGPDPIDAYKSWTDAGWSEPELREAFGG